MELEKVKDTKDTNRQLSIPILSPLTNLYLYLPEDIEYWNHVKAMLLDMRYMKPRASDIWPLCDDEEKMFRCAKIVYKYRTPILMNWPHQQVFYITPA